MTTALVHAETWRRLDNGNRALLFLAPMPSDVLGKIRAFVDAVVEVLRRSFFDPLWSLINNVVDTLRSCFGRFERRLIKNPLGGRGRKLRRAARKAVARGR